jgi:tetratricopeptide (TPR) repeat protein
MANSASKDKKLAAVGGGIRWMRYALPGAVCALVLGVYAGSASSGVLELMGSGAGDSYYNLLVQGFRDGHLNLKTEVPPDIAQFVHDEIWLDNHGLHDLSYYKGKLYLYFGVTPAVMLFWPYVALTGHYLLHKDAVLIFFSAGFLAGAGLLWAVWRRYFKESGIGVLAAGTLALGLANFAPAILGRCDVYEVAISCGYALTMLALGGIWCALQDGRRAWRWLAGASLAYGLAVGARPSLVLGGIILLAPVAQAWREKRRVWPLVVAAVCPMAAIGAGLMIYNGLRFDNPLDFGQGCQLPLTIHQQFRLRFFWFNFRVGFLDPARWSGRFPFVHDIELPAPPVGYCNVHHPFGVLSNIPLVWLALAAPLAWRGRPVEGRSNLRWFLGAVALLFGMCALPLGLHDSMCVRYEIEFASPLVLLAIVGVLAVERALAGQPAWRRAARCGWGLLLVFSAAFNLFASFELQADSQTMSGDALLKKGSAKEAIIQYQKTLQIEPDFAPAHYSLGAALEQLGRVDEAIAQYQKAAEIQPEYMEPHFSLGNVYLNKGKLDEAIAQYRKAAEIRPDFALTHNNMGTALMREGKSDEAIPLFQMALQLKHEYLEARVGLANALLQKGKMDEAIAQFREALQSNPESALVRNNFGNALLRAGRTDEALAQFQKAVEIQPDAAVAHLSLAIVLQQTGKVDEAITQYQDALRLQPDFVAAHHNLGAALLQKGRAQEAIAHFQKALDINPSDPGIQNDLALILATASEASLRNGGKAVELARQANLLTGGENPVALRTLAAACAEAGRFSEAVETAQHALRLAEAQSNTALTAALQSELKLYQAGSAWHGPEQTP